VGDLQRGRQQHDAVRGVQRAGRSGTKQRRQHDGREGHELEPAGDAVTISNRQTNGNPNNVTFVTQVFNPGGKGGIADKSSADVSYGGAKEFLLNWDGPQQKIGTAYDVLIFSS
jgi:hypothetical protein